MDGKNSGVPRFKPGASGSESWALPRSYVLQVLNYKLDWPRLDFSCSKAARCQSHQIFKVSSVDFFVVVLFVCLFIWFVRLVCLVACLCEKIKNGSASICLRSWGLSETHENRGLRASPVRRNPQSCFNLYILVPWLWLNATLLLKGSILVAQKV